MKYEPVLFSQILKGAGIKDHHTIRKRLIDLIKENRISQIKLIHIPQSNKKRIHYHIIPQSEKMSNLIFKETLLSKLGNSYYDGIKYETPIHFQMSHKLQLLNKEFQSTLKYIKTKSKDSNSIKYFESENIQFIDGLIKVLEFVTQSIENKSYDSFREAYDDDQMRMAIGDMDKIYHVYKEVKSNKKAVGPIKTLIANLLIENTKSRAMKTMNMSSKTGSKLYRELFNDDDSPKVDLLNEINEKSIGKKESLPLFPSGETLLKKWKKIKN